MSLATNSKKWKLVLCCTLTITLWACGQHRQSEQAADREGDARPAQVVLPELAPVSPQKAQQRPMAMVADARLEGKSYRLSSGIPVRPGPGSYPVNHDEYQHIKESGFKDPGITPLSTFGLDVSTAAYSNIRRFIRDGVLPPVDAVRLEEMVNYFDYPVASSNDQETLSIHGELAASPWSPDHQLAMVQLRAKDVAENERQPNRFVFLIDTSGSMHGPDRLPLLKRAFLALVEELDGDDRVAIVAYAGSAGVVLPSVSGLEKTAISQALSNLQSGGATAGQAGIQQAYQLARSQFDPKANNRVILATDGDFNVGLRNTGELVKLIGQQRDSGIFLTILGFGRGNLGDARMHQIADSGDGNYYYIDSELEARRVLVSKLQQSLVTVARDVKLQVEFNPRHVAKYRLLGYESRRMAAEDFRNDKKDAGEVGAGQVVTALYEIIPRSQEAGDKPGDLRYQQRQPSGDGKAELMQVSLRYRPLDGGKTRELSHRLQTTAQLGQASSNLNWAAAVAEFALLLKDSEYKGRAKLQNLLARAEQLAQSADPQQREQQREFVSLVRQAILLQNAKPEQAAVPMLRPDY